MPYTQATGRSLKEQREQEREANVHHLRIYSHADWTSNNPKWLVEEHHSENDDRPTQYEYSDGGQLLNHVATVASVSREGHKPNDDLGRQILPTRNDLQNVN